MPPTTDRHGQVIRRRWAAAAILASVLSLVVVIVVVASRSTTTATRAPAVRAPTTPATTTAPTAAPPFAVGTLSFVVSEPATTATPARSFTTYVRYPTQAPTASGPDGSAPAAPLRRSGPYPLVVFSGGYAVSPEEYSGLLDAWAAAGFVVADPVYPFTAPTSAGGLDEGDIVHHPGDLSAVITALVAADHGSGAGPEAALAGSVDTGAVSVVGHSDGGDVSLATVADTCCRDARIHAAVILSGAEDTVFGGRYFSGIPAVPILVVQGTADDINPPGCSVQLYGQASPPKYYLSMEGQSHQGPYLDPGTARDTVQQVVVDFLLATMEGSTSAQAAMVRDGNVAGSSSLAVGTPTVGTGSACPGAPAG